MINLEPVMLKKTEGYWLKMLTLCLKVHPRRENFVAAEKGNQPNILIYEYPSLRLYHILRGEAPPTPMLFFHHPMLSFKHAFLSCRWHNAHIQLSAIQPRWDSPGQCGRSFWLHVDGVELEAGGGGAEVQGHFSGGLQSQLLPIRARTAHDLRIWTHQVTVTIEFPST